MRGRFRLGQDYQAGQVEIDDLWVRASAPGQSNGAGYMEIDNKATAADRLLSVSSSAAERVELHTVETKDGVAKMRQVEGGIALPAGGEVKLAPGGYHVMFLKLKAPSPKALRCPPRSSSRRPARSPSSSGQARRAQPRHEPRPQLDEALSARRSAEQRKRDARSTERASLHLNDRELRALHPLH